MTRLPSRCNLARGTSLEVLVSRSVLVLEVVLPGVVLVLEKVVSLLVEMVPTEVVSVLEEVVLTGVVSVLEEVVLTGGGVNAGGGGATATIYGCKLFSVIYLYYILTRLTFTIRC